jgi:hypothetical protein
MYFLFWTFYRSKHASRALHSCEGNVMLCKSKCRTLVTQHSKSTTTIHAIGQMSVTAEQVVAEKSIVNTGNK